MNLRICPASVGDLAEHLDRAPLGKAFGFLEMLRRYRIGEHLAGAELLNPAGVICCLLVHGTGNVWCERAGRMAD